MIFKDTDLNKYVEHQILKPQVKFWNLPWTYGFTKPRFDFFCDSICSVHSNDYWVTLKASHRHLYTLLFHHIQQTDQSHLSWFSLPIRDPPLKLVCLFSTMYDNVIFISHFLSPSKREKGKFKYKRWRIMIYSFFFPLSYKCC